MEATTFLRGGAGVFVTRLSQALKQRGHQVHVVSSGTVEEMADWPELLLDLRKFGIDHLTCNFFKRENSIFWPEVVRLAAYLREHSIDVIHVHAGVPALGAHLAKIMSGMDTPIIATFHSWSKERPEWMNIQDTWAFNQCVDVCFDSEEYRRLGLSFGLNARNSVIYPGLLIEPMSYISEQDKYRRSLKERFGLHTDARVITNLAEITERKGQLDLVYAMKEIIKNEPNAYVILIGEYGSATYREKLEDVIQFNNLQDRVIFAGWVKDPYELVVGSDLFVFPSYSEGLGLAIIEAISLGVPAIFSFEEGMKDIANHLGVNGFGTFQPGNVQQIALAVTELLSASREELEIKVLAAAAEMRDFFAFAKTVDQYESLLNEAVLGM